MRPSVTFPMPVKRRPGRSAARGLSLIGLLFWAVVISFAALITLRVLPTVNEYLTLQKAVDKVARGGGTSVPEIRAAFERVKQIEYSISSVSGKDLEITKDNDKIIISFAYDKEVELFGPVFLLIKYRGQSK